MVENEWKKLSVSVQLEEVSLFHEAMLNLTCMLRKVCELHAIEEFTICTFSDFLQ